MADELGGLLRTLDPYYSRDVITLTAGASVEQALESLWPDYDRIILAPAGPDGISLVCMRQAMLSKILIDLREGTLVKRPCRFLEFGILAREAAWLRHLSGSGVAPRLIRSDSLSLTMTYCGEPVFQGNLPVDWREQAEGILFALRDARCSHNDIKCENLTVASGRLTLIDFGFATQIGACIPSDWPVGIGRQHRIDIHRFDDRKAIFEALLSAEEDRLDRSIIMPAG